MKGKHPCPKCGFNDWTPVLDVDGPPYDLCNECGYKFTSKDVPRARARITPLKAPAMPRGGRMCGSSGIH